MEITQSKTKPPKRFCVTSAVLLGYHREYSSQIVGMPLSKLLLGHVCCWHPKHACLSLLANNFIKVNFVILNRGEPLKQKHRYSARQLCFLAHAKDLIWTGGLTETWSLLLLETPGRGTTAEPMCPGYKPLVSWLHPKLHPPTLAWNLQIKQPMDCFKQGINGLFPRHWVTEARNHIKKGII